ncbi:MAG: DNA primase [Desulfomonile tiedjei]|nr:DNA primase [Desulfomonile tiedjei]
MRISESKLAEVAAAADIVQVISDHVELKKAGKDYRGLCPFHGDKDPSFYVSPQKGIFYCFGCGVGGSVFNFIMKMENTSFVEAVQTVARRYGVPLQLEAGGRRTGAQRARLIRALEVSHDYFVDKLKFNRSAADYLADRGLPPEWIERLGLGYAPDSWEGLSDHLRRSGVEPQDAVAAGVLRPRAGGGYYDHFRSRIMIPIRDLNGQVVAFGGRIFGEGDPKYLNSPDTPLFHKKGLLYGLDSAREAIRREGRVIIVEGYFDQISLRIRGMENTVAPLGTALGREQIRLVKRFSDDVITVFDADEAGIRAVKRSIPLFLAEGVEPRCLILKQHKDPDEAVNSMGTDAFRSLLDTSVSMIDFLLDAIEAQYDLKTLQGRNLAVEECLPVLREIADSKEGDYLIERFSFRIRVREDRLRRMLSSGAGASHANREDRSESKRSLFDFPADERNVVRGMLLRQGFIDRVTESGVLKDLEDNVLSALAHGMVRFREQMGGFEPVAFSTSLEDERLASVVAGWLRPKPEEDDLRPEVDGDLTIDHSLDRIRLKKLERRKAEIQERMNHCAPGEEEYNNLARELWTIGRRLHK